MPAYNEEKTIGKLLKVISKKWKVFVIDDKSKDQTFDIVKKFDINLIQNESNIGYSRTIQKGIKKVKESGYRYAITFDCDGEHQTKDIPEVARLLKKGNFLVVGSRNKKNRFVEIIVAFFTSLFLDIDDPFCGLKGYDLNHIDKNCDYLEKPMEDVNTFIMMNFVKRKLRFCNFKIITGERSFNENSRFGISILGEIKLLKSLRYWV